MKTIALEGRRHRVYKVRLSAARAREATMDRLLKLRSGKLRATRATAAAVRGVAQPSGAAAALVRLRGSMNATVH
jgi:hypothetical protein